MDEFSYPFSTLENVKSKGFYKTWLQFQSNNTTSHLLLTVHTWKKIFNTGVKS